MSRSMAKPRRSLTNWRRLVFEVFEDRRMLSAAADIVFLVDNSESDNHVTKEWLSTVVTGDVNQNGIVDTGELNLSERLAAQGVDDVRYGVVAYGEQYITTGLDRFAHSLVVDTDQSNQPMNRLFSNGVTKQDHIADLKSAIDHLIEVERGGNEDGWDAITTQSRNISFEQARYQFLCWCKMMRAGLK